MRTRLRRYWWLWISIAIAVAVLNELFDWSRGGESGQPFADVVLAIAVVAVVAYAWEFIARRKLPRAF